MKNNNERLEIVTQLEIAMSVLVNYLNGMTPCKYK